MQTIVICSSVAFYKQAIAVKNELEAMGFSVVVPTTAIQMEATGDYEVSHYKTWFGDANDYHKKTALMRQHFDEVSNGDVVLVLNYKKHGVDNYIGGNVLMEMSLGFFLHKPLYVLNDLPNDSPFLEELIGMGSIPLHGKLAALGKLLKA